MLTTIPPPHSLLQRGFLLRPNDLQNLPQMSGYSSSKSSSNNVSNDSNDSNDSRDTYYLSGDLLVIWAESLTLEI